MYCYFNINMLFVKIKKQERPSVLQEKITVTSLSIIDLKSGVLY